MKESVYPAFPSSEAPILYSLKISSGNILAAWEVIETTMEQEYIEIRGARENNLKEVSLRLPKRKITIFTGVSGSGKSSLVFDTIANEA